MTVTLKSITSLPWEQLQPVLKKNWEKIVEQDTKARKAGTLVGRYLREPVADGNAIYVITKVYKRTVHIRYVPEVCPDEYRVAYFKDKDSIKREYAEKSVQWRDNLRRMFDQ